MTEETAQKPELGRNEPCFCGSGKKYKRCHGVGAAPKFTAPKPMPSAPSGLMAGGMPGGFDPSQMDPKMMLQFTQALQRLPKGQLQKLQAIMQRAMSGKDVTREAEDFEQSLPVDIQQLMKNFSTQMPGMGGMGGDMSMPAMQDIEVEASSVGDAPAMTAEQAREIVAAAAADGKISRDEAEKLLSASSSGTEEEKKTGFAKFWRGISGKDT